MKCPKCDYDEHFEEVILAKVVRVHVNLGDGDFEVQEQRVEEVKETISICCGKCNYEGPPPEFWVEDKEEQE